MQAKLTCLLVSDQVGRSFLRFTCRKIPTFIAVFTDCPRRKVLQKDMPFADVQTR